MESPVKSIVRALSSTLNTEMPTTNPVWHSTGDIVPNFNNEEDVVMLDVFCINCHHLIKIEDIDSHSNFCTKFVDEASETYRMNYKQSNEVSKISRLMERINDVVEQKSIKPSDSSFLKVLHRFANRIVNSKEEKLKGEIEQIVSSLDSVIEDSMVSMLVILYAERLKNMINEILLNIDMDELDKCISKTEKLKAQLDNYKNYSKDLSELIYSNGISPILSKKIEDINSDIHSKYSDISEITSQSTVNEGQINEEEFIEFPDIHPEAGGLRRFFYSECLSIKLGFPANSNAQKVPVGVLYQKALDDGIKPENWQEFIKIHLSQAEKFLGQGFNKNRRRKNPSIAKIPIIEEEED